MNARPVSLYDDAELVTIRSGGVGADAVRICVGRSAALATTGVRKMLLLHGNPSHMAHFDPLVPTLRRFGEVAAYDHPGFGRSDDWSGPVTLERSADLALDLLDHLGWHEPVDLVGQSHGAMVSLALAARRPERVASVILLGSGGTPAHRSYRWLALPGVGPLLEGAARALFQREALRSLATRVTRAAARHAFAPDRVPAEVVDGEVHDLMTRPELLRSMAALAQDDPCAKVAGYASRVVAPVLFVHGRDDRLVPIAYARRLHALAVVASRSSFVEVPGGHMVHYSHPGRVEPHLASWLGA